MLEKGRVKVSKVAERYVQCGSTRRCMPLDNICLKISVYNRVLTTFVDEDILTRAYLIYLAYRQSNVIDY